MIFSELKKFFKLAVAMENLLILSYVPCLTIYRHNCTSCVYPIIVHSILSYAVQIWAYLLCNSLYFIIFYAIYDFPLLWQPNCKQPMYCGFLFFCASNFFVKFVTFMLSLSGLNLSSYSKTSFFFISLLKYSNIFTTI